MKNRVVIRYKEFLYETFERMSFEDLVQYHKEVCDDAIDVEEHGGAPVFRIDDVLSRKAGIIRDYLGENYKEEMKKYVDSVTDFTLRKIEDDIKEMHKCENCGTETNFTLNCCEECFDNAIDDYYSED